VARGPGRLGAGQRPLAGQVGRLWPVGRGVDAALRGFIRCSDGRLYNKTLAEKANSAWESRLQYEWRKAGDRHRKAERDLPTDQRSKFPDFEDWKAGARPSRSGGTDDLFRRTDPAIPTENALKGMEGKGLLVMLTHHRPRPSSPSRPAP
jgi:hypothetical protein